MSIQTINEIRMRVEADGVVTVDTGAFTKEVHLEAEQLIDSTFEALGGERKVVYRKPHDHQSHVQVLPTNTASR